MNHETVDKRFICFRYERNDDVYAFSVFGHALYQRVGDVSCVDVCGYNIYERVGNVRSIFGIGWVSNG